MLVKWLAHYLAQQLITAESSTGEEKEQAEKACCDTILKLWSHQADFPHGSRPFKEFDEIFETLNRINPNESRAYYATVLDDEVPNEIPEQAKTWLELAISADSIARELISMSLAEAAKQVTTKESEKWLAASDELASPSYKDIIGEITDQDQPTDDENDKANQIESLEKRLILIKSFINNGEQICLTLSQQLEELRAEQ